MTKARTNASASPAVGRNMVINGAMNVAQRGTSETGIGSTGGYFTCDRWKIGTSSHAGQFTMSQTADGPNGISANCIKLDCTTADTSIAAGEALNIQQRFEGQNLQRIGKGVAGAQQITVSFYVKASAAFTFGCELLDLDNSRQVTKLFNTTTDWNRIELTFSADVDDGSSPFDDDNASSLRLSFHLHAGSNFTSGTLNTAAFANRTDANRAVGIDSFFSSTDNNFFITGVQMEVGPVATEFEQEDISTTLGKCQRYYVHYAGASGATHKRFGNGKNATTTISDIIVALPCELRTTPTIVTTGTASDYSTYHANTVTANSALPNINTATDAGVGNLVGLDATVGSGLTAGQGVQLMANNNADTFLAFDAEL